MRLTVMGLAGAFDAARHGQGVVWDLVKPEYGKIANCR
jgi:hypothetical protein